MKGIIIKPSPCCGYSGSLGLPVETIGKPTPTALSQCTHCGTTFETKGFVLLTDDTVIQENRVKWFPDFKEDFLIEEKEKEGV